MSIDKIDELKKIKCSKKNKTKNTLSYYLNQFGILIIKKYVHI